MAPATSSTTSYLSPPTLPQPDLLSASWASPSSGLEGNNDDLFAMDESNCFSNQVGGLLYQICRKLSTCARVNAVLLSQLHGHPHSYRDLHDCRHERTGISVNKGLAAFTLGRIFWLPFQRRPALKNRSCHWLYRSAGSPHSQRHTLCVG